MPPVVGEEGAQQVFTGTPAQCRASTLSCSSLGTTRLLQHSEEGRGA